MKEKYWFRAGRYGYGWSPSTWQGWLVVLFYVVANVYSLIQAIGETQSEEALFFAYIPKVLLFSALLIIITYLKGEPVAWHWGEKKKDK